MAKSPGGSAGKSAQKGGGKGTKKYGRDVAKKLRAGRAYRGAHKKNGCSVKRAHSALFALIGTARWMGPAFQL
jgi:hypothetical protein